MEFIHPRQRSLTACKVEMLVCYATARRLPVGWVLFWNYTGRPKSESRDWFFGHLVELALRLPIRPTRSETDLSPRGFEELRG